MTEESLPSPDSRKERLVEIAHRLQEARKTNHLTQAEAAQIIGCSLARYSRIERGQAELSLIEAELLAKAYQVPITYFLRRLAEYDPKTVGYHPNE